MATKLLQISSHEAENPFEVSLRQAFELLKPQLTPPFPLTIPTPEEYSQLNHALLFALLTQPHLSKIHITHLHAIVTDGYAFFVGLATKLVFESYPKIIEKRQLVFITRKLVEVSAVGVPGLLIILLRWIVGGDFGDENLWLCGEVISVFLDNWDWVLEEPLLVTSALYVYLRMLADHYKLPGLKFEDLKRMEVEFCVRILRNHFRLCLRIGRDLIRLLQGLVYIPEFKYIWKDLLLNPSGFGANEFVDISQLYCTRTSSRYIILHITPEMETHLRFLLTHVKWGFQNRYQAWFSRKYLCRPEGESVIVDIVRFICCAHYPPNEIIQSNVIPRWVVIGWLLTCCSSSHVDANAKLALLYDWMFYNERADNIMNIEPGILLMLHSMPKYVDMTRALLEFLFKLVDSYDVQRKEIIVRGVSTAFDVLVKKGVVHSLEAFTHCSLLSPLLKQKLANVTSLSDLAVLPHCNVPKQNLSSTILKMKKSMSTVTPECPSESGTNSTTFVLVTPVECPRENGINTTSPIRVAAVKCPRENGINSSPIQVAPVECPREDGINITSPLSVTPVDSGNPQVMPNRTPVNIVEDFVRTLGEFTKRSYDLGLQILEELLIFFANCESQSLDVASLADSILHPETLACRVTEAFKSNGYDMFVPLGSTSKLSCDVQIQSATTLVICTFIFCQNRWVQDLFMYWSRNGYQVGPRFLSYILRLAHEAREVGCWMTSKGENKIMGISELLTPTLKHHFDKYVSYASARGKDSGDIFSSASNGESEQIVELIQGAFASYKSFLMLSNKENTSLVKLLFLDMISCCDSEKKIFTQLVCNIFHYFPDLSTGNQEFICLLLENLDYADLIALHFKMCLENFSMFGEDADTVSHVIKSSFNWGLEEQKKLWAMMSSEGAISKVQADKVVENFFQLGVLDPHVHSIAVGGLFTLCCRRAPTFELVNTMISLPDNTFEGFAASVLANWAVSNRSMLFSSLGRCLETSKKDGNSVSLTSTGIKLNNSSISKFLDFLHQRGDDCTDCVDILSVNVPEIKARLANAAAAH